MPLIYHPGQIAVQEEAQTRIVADKLAHWVGPVAEFSVGADLFLLASADADGTLRFATIAGAPPLVEVAGPSSLRFCAAPTIAIPAGGDVPCGGLAINLGQARRARVNGTLRRELDGSLLLEAAETFTLCRKYMAPSLAIAEARTVGPLARESLSLADPWLGTALATAETAFLASVSPEGGPDVAHRGGPAGFIEFDPASGQLTWPEYIGDGVFKSAGNVRATGTVTLLVVDLETGDGVELTGSGGYTTVRTERRQRVDPLVQHRDPFPIQGMMVCQITSAQRLRGLMAGRRRIEKAVKITSRSTVDDQAPQ